MESLFWSGGGTEPHLFGSPAEPASEGESLGPVGGLGTFDGVWIHYRIPGFAPAFFTDFIGMVETQDGREVLPAADSGNVAGAVLVDIYTLALVQSPAAAIRVQNHSGLTEPVDYDIPLPTLQTLYGTYGFTSASAAVTTSAAGNGLLAANVLVWDSGTSQYRYFAYLVEFDLEGVIRENAVEAGHPIDSPIVFPGKDIMCATWWSLISGSNVAANYAKYAIDSATPVADTTVWLSGSDYNLQLVCHDGFIVRRYNRSTFVTDAAAYDPDGTLIRTVPIESPTDEYQYNGISLAQLVRYPVRTNNPTSAVVYDAINDTLYPEYDPAGTATFRLYAFDNGYAHGWLTDDTAWPPLPGSIKQHYALTANLVTGEWTVGVLLYRTSSESAEFLPAVHALEYGRTRAAG